MSYQALWGDSEVILKQINVKYTKRTKKPENITCGFP